MYSHGIIYSWRLKTAFIIYYAVCLNFPNRYLLSDLNYGSRVKIYFVDCFRSTFFVKNPNMRRSLLLAEAWRKLNPHTGDTDEYEFKFRRSGFSFVS